MREALYDVSDGEIQSPQLLEVEFDLDLAPQAARNPCLCDAWHPLKAKLQTTFGKMPQLLRIHLVGSDGDEHDRELRRVELIHLRRVHVIG